MKRQRLHRNLCIAAAVCGFADNAFALDTTYIGPTGGAWTNPAFWTNGVPNGIAFSAHVDGGSPSDALVSIGSLINIGSLTITPGDSVRIDPNGELNVAASISNSGTLNLQDRPVRGGSSTTLTLNGGGTVLMAGGFIGGSGTAVLLNQDNTIRGRGSLGFRSINAGSVIADVPGETLFVPSLQNQNLIRAVEGGILSLSGGTIQNHGGRIEAADNSTINLVGSLTIAGGTIATTGSGVMRFAESFQRISLRDVTLEGRLITNGSSILYGAGSIVNNGTIDVVAAFDGAFVGTNLGSFTLAGNGRIVLSEQVNGPGRAVIGFAGGGTITTGPFQTISGVGIVANSGIGMINNGTILASESGRVLLVDPMPLAGAFLNNGTFVAMNGGILQVTGQGGGGVTNNGVVTAHAGSIVRLTDALTIAGGTFASAGGTIEIASGHVGTLSNATITGGFYVQPAARLNVQGVLNHFGTLVLNSGSLAPATNGTATFSGSGRIILGGANGPGVLAGGGGVLDLDLFVSGRGAVAANNTRIVNRGTIAASGGEIVIDPTNVANGFRNFGTLRADPDATLRITGQFGGALSNTGGHVHAAAGGTILLDTGLAMTGGSISLDGTLHASGNSNSAIVSFRGAGTLHVSDSARVSLIAGGGSLGTSLVSSVSVTTGGRLDLADHDLGVDYNGPSPIADLRTLLQSGFDNGNWNGSGVHSSAAAASASSGRTAIGYAEATDVLGANPQWFSGVAVDATSVLLRYTLAGDATLDYTVNISDFSRLGARFNQAGVWFDGDFNYDGTVNIGDFSLLAANFNKTLPAPRPGPVPEPAGVTALLLLAWSLKRNRARQSRSTCRPSSSAGL